MSCQLLSDDIENHVFSNQNIAKWLSFDSLNKHTQKNKVLSQRSPIKEPIKEPIKQTQERFFPSQKDSLFWCFYIAKYGLFEYELNKINSFKIEKDMKILAIEKLREKKAILKEKKIKLTLIEADLITKQFINVHCLQALCIAFDVSIKYVTNTCYYNFYYGDDNISFVKNQKTHNAKCFVKCEPTKDELNKIDLEYFYIENVAKPILGQNNYTLSALQDVCSKLNIPIKDNNGKRYVKKKLYDAIVATIS